LSTLYIYFVLSLNIRGDGIISESNETMEESVIWVVVLLVKCRVSNSSYNFQIFKMKLATYDPYYM